MTALAPVLAMITPHGVIRYTTPASESRPARESRMPAWAAPLEGRTAVATTIGQLRRGDHVTLPLLTYTTGQTDTITGTVITVLELSTPERAAGPCDVAVYLAEHDDFEVRAESSRPVTVMR